MKRAVIRCNEGYAESMSTQTIAEFLEARISEDEARASSGWARLGDSRWETTECGQDFLTPTAVLAECAAKRVIIEVAESEPGSLSYLCPLAAIYKDHADYREEWA